MPRRRSAAHSWTRRLRHRPQQRRLGLQRARQREAKVEEVGVVEEGGEEEEEEDGDAAGRRRGAPRL
jgi:hypothetical protein